ncbi:type II secretion system F family protein [Caldibacillus lycopersici]|uniref:Type II secretion system F family protein n=1 Tax=Perspicuibacillus lycopersici TaxID=1325689 RepID=A0AAE3LN29_9BACI|nr:type II secretion system F family protein [Perspicuibacillus lycopersici]MCU9613526.1 type II secretion system F family protein [Perspicuibacillus lycopersici]
MLFLILWVTSFLFFTFLSFLLMNRLWKNKMEMNRRLAPFYTSATDKQFVEGEEEETNRSFYARFLLPLVEKLRLFTIGKMPKNKLEQLEKKLQAAGHPFGLSAGDFLLLQILLPLGLFLLFTVLFIPSGNKIGQIILYSFFIAVFVYFYMNYYLTAKSNQRTKLIDKSMPDFFDMLNVSLEAGMGLDGALRKVSLQMDSPLSTEFLSALDDMKLGKSRKQAFTDLRDRVHSEFFKSVMNSLIQADQMGIGMTKVLRTQTERIREKQRFTAKEKAMKAPVKMLIPMVLFIFPTLFIVLLGPIVINLVTQFL